MNKVQYVTAVILFFTMRIYAQETILKLPTADNTSSFKITDSSSTNLFTVDGTGKAGIKQASPRAELEIGGTDGLLVTGTLSSGTTRALGAGFRMHWYPRKGTFRVGYSDGAYWDDDGSAGSSIGYFTIAMGYAPRAMNISSVAIGAYNQALASYSLALGHSSQATGESSIAIGEEGAIASGEYSIALGCGVNTNHYEGAVVIGDHYPFATTTASAENQLNMRFCGGYRLFTIADNTVGVSLAKWGSSWESISDSTKKTNFVKADGEYFLISLSKLKLGSWNYKTQDKNYRHYGPMAQEIFRYFGKDGLGVIGSDTTLASADIDGIMMICLQALEKRTDELTKQNVEYQKQNEVMKEKITQLEKGFEEMKALVAGLANKKEPTVQPAKN
jgi:hypothetical protein